MATPRTRRWRDREGREWEVVYNPSVELDPPPVRQVRERIVFRGDGASYHAPAAYGGALEALSDGDLQGLLDQARESQAGETSPWGTPIGGGDGDE